MPTSPTERGFYVDLEKTPSGNLTIRLNESGRAQFVAIEEVRESLGINEALHTLLEDHLSSGWEMVPPEDIGALTAAPILSDEVERDDQGRIIAAGRVYWYPEYQVHDEIQELREHLQIVLTGVALE